MKRRNHFIITLAVAALTFGTLTLTLGQRHNNWHRHHEWGHHNQCNHRDASDTPTTQNKL